jgi:pseudaminic acid biosynthesis-associated methylase
MNTQKKTDQIAFWASEEGQQYTDRNPQSVEHENSANLEMHGISRSDMNDVFLGTLDKSSSMLEVGANLGLQLEILRQGGFTNARGVELNPYAVEQSKKIHPEVNIIQGSGFELPFDDASFDLVYTSGVLIHISPETIPDFMREIHRVSKRYIWGFEYYAPELTEIEYRGRKNLLWKRDFAGLYQELFSDLKLVKEEKYPIKGTENIDTMFLLEKHQ